MSSERVVVGGDASTPNAYHIPAVSRAIAVMEALGRSRKPKRLADLARELEVPRASLFSILTTLNEEGVIERDGMTYRLGDRLAFLSSNVGSEAAVRRAARPTLSRLVAQLAESAQVAVADGGMARYVEALEGTQTLRVGTWVGKLNAIEQTAIGKALILDRPRAELRAIVPALSDDELAVLERELAEARTRGYTLDEGTGEAGVHCVGAPIRDASGTIVAALSVAAPIAQLTPAHVDNITRLVVAAAAEIGNAQ